MKPEVKKRNKNFSENKSQTEISSISIKDSYIEVNGYQSFKVNSGKIFDESRKLDNCKQKNVTNIVINNKHYCKTVLDIGCSQGYYSFFSYFNGYKVTGLEHDKSYYDNLIKIKTYLNMNSNIEFKNQKFGLLTDETRYDICLFLAIIHWVYSCTDYFGSLTKIINKLYNITNKILIIEWISPEILKNMYLNTEVKINENYTFDNFQRAISIFSKVERYESSTNTREIFVCFK
jgi:SAM-dependent methyltransferase